VNGADDIAGLKEKVALGIHFDRSNQE